MTAGERVVHVCKTILKDGPIGYTKQRPLWRKFAACNYPDQDLSTVRSPWGTSCGVFARAVLHWAGRLATRKAKIGQPMNNGWLEGLTFRHPAWVWNNGSAKPTPGCLFARDYNKATTGLYHVGFFISEDSPGLWHTAEGGGGDGSECRLSDKPKALDGKDGLNRHFLGWWRPEALAAGADFAPGWAEFEPVAPIELFAFPGLERTTAEFRTALIALGAKLDIDPNALAAVMSIESGFRPDALNPHANAVGLIQFMPFLLKHWGLSVEQVKRMSAVDQLALVGRFYQNAAGHYDDDPGTLYMLTFMPAAAYFPDNYVLGEKDSEEIHWGLKLHKIWEQNQGLDRDKDGDIEVGEVKSLARDRYALGKSRGPYRLAHPEQPTLRLKAGFPKQIGGSGEQHQSAVRLIQIAAGVKADGFWGPKTDAAVEAWQRANGLVADRIFGPKSWAKLYELKKSKADSNG